MAKDATTNTIESLSAMILPPTESDTDTESLLPLTNDTKSESSNFTSQTKMLLADIITTSLVQVAAVMHVASHSLSPPLLMRKFILLGFAGIVVLQAISVVTGEFSIYTVITKLGQSRQVYLYCNYA